MLLASDWMVLTQKQLMITCFLCSFFGLILIYLSATNIQPKSISISEMTSDLIGRAVTATGYISYKRTHPAGHLFLTLSDNISKIEIPLFSSFMSELNKNGIVEKNFTVGKELTITGLVSEYNGQLQIQPRKVSDIKIGE